MTTTLRDKCVRIDVSESVHTRLLKYGNSFPQRIRTLLACKEVITHPIHKAMGARMGIHMSAEDHATLKTAQETLNCASISNVIESMLNTSPNIPLHAVISNELENEVVASSVRLKTSDHAKIKQMAREQAIPMWLIIHNLLPTPNPITDPAGEEEEL